MGNIVGEKFENYVLNQIAARQRLYGQSYSKNQKPRTPQQLQLMNNKNAWLKMASSVGVESDNSPATFNRSTGTYVDKSISHGEQRLKNIGINNTSRFTGNKLSEQTVLFNTLSTVIPSTEYSDKTGVGLDGSYNFRSGVSKTNSLWNSSNSYGLGGTDQGLVPAPGLISFTVDSQNRGSIRKGTVELMCYNKFQFELIELVYLRLGYTMMIEWGWDKYTTNSQNIKDVGNTIIEDIWFNNGSSNMTQLQMIKNIDKYKEIYSGNYDGFYGRVTNFNWKFESDGTYKVRIDLYSIGDVIESIKVDSYSAAINLEQVKNSVKADEKKFGTERSPTGLGLSPIVTNAGSTALAQSMFTDVVNRSWDEGGSDYLNPSTFFLEASTKLNKLRTTEAVDRFNYYMTFGALINKLKTFVVPTIVNESGFAQDMIYFDSGEEEYCAIYPNQISLDPRVCVIKPAITNNTNPQASDRKTSGYVYFDPGWNRFKQFAFAEEISGGVACTYGKIRNIYLNYDFISTQLAKATQTVGLENQLSLYSFLTSICNGINKSLGDVNNLEVQIRDDNRITIGEQNPIPGIEKLPGLADRTREVPSFELFGFNPDNNQSNFVKEFSFDTQITPELASSITIGATGNGGTTKNYDATAFSKWNTGLYDRFNMEMIDPATKSIMLQNIQLSAKATELGLIGNEEISALEGVVLYDAFINSENDGNLISNFEDYELGKIKLVIAIAQTTGNIADWGAEKAYDGLQWIGNGFRSEKNKVDINQNNVGDLMEDVPPNLADNIDQFYAKNRTSTALNVTLPGRKTIPANSVYGEIGDELTWAEYIAQITEARIAARKIEGEGNFTIEELLEKFGGNYSFYLTRVFGGDFVAGTNDSEETITEPNEASYWNYNSNIIKEGQSAFKAYINALNNTIFKNTKGKTPSNTIGFIPVSLNLSFEGLSGIKIYNQINLVQGFLPDLYPATLKFIIKTVNHTIDNNQWTSTIDTVSTPRTYPSQNFNFDDLQSAADDYQRGGVNGGSMQEYFGPAPNAKKVREYIFTTGGFITEKRTGDPGNGGSPTVGYHPETEATRGELSSGGDISSEAAEMTITVIKALRLKQPTIRINITGGNDLYHQNKPTTYTSRHKSGNGVDFTVDNPTPANLNTVMETLNSFLVGPKNWWYIDEYGSPTEVSTESHFHMSVGNKPEKSGEKQIPIAQAQLAKGIIQKLP